MGALLAGAVVVDYGVKSFKTATAGAATDPGPSGGSTATPGTVTPTDPGIGGGSVSNVAGTIVGDVTGAMLSTIGASHGWTAQEISDWASVIKLESNGTISDTNPSSGAYGIAQFIDGPGEYATYGGNDSSPVGELIAMANYIAQRYGNPSAALSFHLAHGWY
jgi:hypothetical protein